MRPSREASSLANAVTMLAVLVWMAACDDTVPEREETKAAPPITLSGSVEFLERVGLSPDSRMEIRLYDVSADNAAPVEIAMASIERPGQAPLPFSLTVDAGLLDNTRDYSLGATIFDRNHRILISDRIHPANADGAEPVTVSVVRVAQDKRALPNAPVTGTNWFAYNLYGTATKPANGDAVPHLLLHSAAAVNGTTGCNRYSGSYSLKSNRIDIGVLSVTEMACISHPEQEQAFLRALAAIDEVRVDGHTMAAFSDGRLIAAFEADQYRE